MYEYRLEGKDLYRFDRESRTADAWDRTTEEWQPCPDRYDDIALGFYYEKDDPHWIQTFKCITEEQAKKLMEGEWLEVQPKVKPSVTQRKQPTKAQQKKAFREFLKSATQMPK